MQSVGMKHSAGCQARASDRRAFAAAGAPGARRRWANAPLRAPASSPAPAGGGASVLPPPPSPAIMGVVEALFRIQPLFQAAAGKARRTIVERGRSLGIDWDGTLARRREGYDWEAELEAVTSPAVTKAGYPGYYTQPFHAYADGNLSLEPALEMTMAAVSVHSGVMDPSGKDLRRDGDRAMRSSYMSMARDLMASMGTDPSSVRAVVDLGCATGLSSLALLEAFPGASVTGVDLSPHYLAVASVEQRERRAAAAAAAAAATAAGTQQQQQQGKEEEPLSFLHAAAEDTGLPSGSVDLVSMCLVAHELPQSATRAILREAHRILRPGGVMCVMEMDPSSPAFARIYSNPFAFAAFKATEPHLQEYITLDLAAAFTDAGFEAPAQRCNTPRHRTVVGRKPPSA